MDTAEIRRRFLAHFEAAGHTAVPSASLLARRPQPAVRATPAWCRSSPTSWARRRRRTTARPACRSACAPPTSRTSARPRATARSSRCAATSPSATTSRSGAIELAWDLVTKPQSDGGWGFPEDKLYPSVYVDDPEAVELWKKVTGLPDDRIVRLGKSENYWSMGVPGPGWPVLGDPLSTAGPAYGADGDFSAEDRYLEFWNLVFMQDELSAVAVQGGLRHRRLAAEEEHRHRHGPRARRVPDPGRREHVRDRRDVPRHRARRGAHRQDATAPTTRTTSGSGWSPTTSAAR